MSDKGRWFNFRVDKDLQDFIKFLKKNNFNVSDYLREKLRELEKQYPERIENNGNGAVTIKNRKMREAFEILQSIAIERDYKPIGMETGAVPVIVEKVGVTEDKARDILRRLYYMNHIDVRNKQITVLHELRGES